MKVLNYATLADENEQLKQALYDALLDLKKADAVAGMCSREEEKRDGI